MFKYRLNPLINYRKSLEEKQQVALADANREVLAETNWLGKLQDSRVQSKLWKAEVCKTDTAPETLLLYDEYLLGLDRDIAYRTILERQAMAKANVERNKLNELVKHRRILELHRDRLKSRYEREEARKETLQSDEISTARFIRQTKENE